MNRETLSATAHAMVAPGKGILAMDESHPTCKKRFDTLGIEFTEENRRAYRDMLVTAAGLGDHVGGAILFDETLRQKLLDGCLLYTSPSPRDRTRSRMPSSA